MAAIAANVSRLARTGFTYSFFMLVPQFVHNFVVRRAPALPDAKPNGSTSLTYQCPILRSSGSNAAHQVVMPDGATVTAVTADNLPDFASSGLT